MKRRVYQNIELTKKQDEVIAFLETGSNKFWDAYYNYNGRKKRTNRPTLTISSWFNKTIKSMHEKGLFKEIPFVLHYNGLFIWQNPGVNASKANFECLTLHDAAMEEKAALSKII